MRRRASIIVLNYNRVDLLERCFRSVVDASSFNGGGHEVILLDNDSSDRSVEYVGANFPEVKIIRSNKNEFMFSYNGAIAGSRYDIVILLNNDVFVEKGFVEPLIAHFRDPGVFAVTSKMLSADGKGLLQGRRTGEIKGGFIHASNPGAENERGYTLFASGGASAISKPKFMELGGFDSLYRPFYHEDLDLSYRAWLRGYKVLYEPESVVYHLHSASISKVADPNGRRLRDKINYLFVWKNVSDPIWILKCFMWTAIRLFKAISTFKFAHILGFFDALIRLPQALEARHWVKSFRRISDNAILERIKRNGFDFSLKGRTILLFGYSGWDVWRTSHEFAREFSKDNIVVFVEQQKVDFVRFLKQIFLNRPLVKISGRIYLFKSPAILPYFGFLRPSFLRKAFFKLSVFFSKSVLSVDLRRALRKEGLVPDMLFIHDPLNLFFAKKFGGIPTCYRVHDEVALFPSNAAIRPFIEEFERINIKKIDHIFASSMAQTRKRENSGASVHFLPNACNFELYSAALGDLAIPEDIAAVPGPKAAYMGVIDHRIDFDLMEYAFRHGREISFVFIGPVLDSARRRMEELEKYNNVFFLGNKRHEELPSYLRAIDVSLMPYMMSEQLKTAFPWKMFEHMAAGRPIVSASLPEVLPYKNIVMVAAAPDEFLAKIRESLRMRPHDRIGLGIEEARKNSWEERVAQIKEIVRGN